MANKLYNIYCDESCHLANDHKRYMFLSNISCAYPQCKRHSERIKELKKKYNFYAEIKWTNVSKSKLSFYLELVKYFFDTDLRFRAIWVDKQSLNHEDSAYFEELYYKMYYRLLNCKIDTASKYNVYLDIKDTWSAQKAKRLGEILNTQYGVFNKVQTMRSDESVLLQLSDFLMGAMAYQKNQDDKNSDAKTRVLNEILEHIDSSNYSETEMDNGSKLTFLNLK